MIAVKTAEAEPGWNNERSNAKPLASIAESSLDLRETFLAILGRTDHCIVFYGFTEDGRVLVGDPANHRSGVARWTKEKFTNAWTGEGFYLEKRL